MRLRLMSGGHSANVLKCKGSGLFLDLGFQPEQPDRYLLVERKRVVGPTEAWKGESPSDYDLIWDHLSDLLNRKKLY
jgi:hypothetical protein